MRLGIRFAYEQFYAANSHRRRLFALTCVTAVSGYMLADWSLLDSIYMVVITVFGVGYGETRTLAKPELKVFTMGVIIAGCSSGIYVVGGFVQMLAEGEINLALGTRRMSKGIEKLSGHALICGFGRVGQMLAHDLLAAEQALVVIDNNEGRVQEAQAAGYLAVRGSASEEQTLVAAGIDRAGARHGFAGRLGQRVHHADGPRAQPDDRDHRPGRIALDREEAAPLGGEPGRDAGADRRDEDRPYDHLPLGGRPSDGDRGQDAPERGAETDRPGDDRDRDQAGLPAGGTDGCRRRDERLAAGW